MNQIDLRSIDLNLLVVFDVLMHELSVTRTALALGRTQSAISHSLARLRLQLGDPLIVKTAAGMVPSPFAEELIAEVRPALRAMQRMLSPREVFSPRTSSRVFRIAAPDFLSHVFFQLVRTLIYDAPNINIEWIGLGESSLRDLEEGQIDLAIAPAKDRIPDGLAGQPIGNLIWGCYARQDHPATTCWSYETWLKWPHLVVSIGERRQNPVGDAVVQSENDRRVAIKVPSFGAVAPLLSATDLIATLPTLVMEEALDQFRLARLPVPFDLPDMPHFLFWNKRLASDAANLWIRNAISKL